MELLVARLIVFATLAAGGIAVIWVARATAGGRLGRNDLAGIRTPATQASDEAWLAAHRAARVPTEAGGWGSVVAGVACLVVGGGEVGLFIAVLVGTAILLGGTLIGLARGVRAARDIEPPPGAHRVSG